MKVLVHTLFTGLFLFGLVSNASADTNVVADSKTADSKVSTKADAVDQTKPTALQERIDKTKKQLSGEDVPNLGAMASDSVKGLLYILAPLLLGVTLYKRYATKSNPSVEKNKITICSRRAIGPKTALLVVDVEGNRFLLSQSNDDVKLLSTLESNKGLFEEMLIELDDEEVTESRTQTVVHG